MLASTILTSTSGFVRSSAFLAASLALAATLPLPAMAVTTVGYEDFGDTAGVVLWRGGPGTNDFHLATVINVAADGSVGEPYAMKWNQDATTSSHRFCSAQSEYKSPGILLVYDQSGYLADASASFQPLSFGGLWVKALSSEGTPYSVSGANNNGRNTDFGATGASTYFKFEKSFTVNRQHATRFYGNATVEIADGATFTAQAYNGTGVEIDSAASLKLVGASNGVFSVGAGLSVAGTLDISAATRPGINGNVVLSDGATLVLPAGTSLDESVSVSLCTGTLKCNGIVNVSVGGSAPARALLTVENGAITFINTQSFVYTLTLDGTATNWSEGTWTLNGQQASAQASGCVEIVASASTELTVDMAVSLVEFKIKGGTNVVVNIATNGTSGSFLVAKAMVESGVLQQGCDNSLGSPTMVSVNEGATFDLNGHAINASTSVYIAGAGAGNWPWALTSSGGASGAILGGLYLTDNATIGGANEIKVGTTQNGYYLYLQGNTLTKIGTGAFTGTNMNTPGTGTIDLQGGAMSVNQWNNLNNNNGDTTVILRPGTSLANGTDRVVPMGTLKLLGGTLTTAKAFKVKTLLTGSGETARLAFANGASASLAGDLTVTTDLTLDGDMAFNKDVSAAEDVVVTASGTFTASGAVSVGAGVTLKLGTNRPTATFDVDDDATLSVQLQSASDVVELSVRAQPASIVLYDANGEIISNPRISYADGTLTIMPPVPTLEASGAVSFDTASNWINSTMPEANGDAIIELATDATVTVSGTYTLGALTITGSGEVTFAGDGSVSAANILLKNGATLVRNSTKISATTGIAVDSGTVLKLDTVQEDAVISGAGAVETKGSVKFTADNTFTGGLTVNLGSLARTTTAQGFGANGAGAALANLSRIVVRDGGSLDLANTINTCYAITIAGKGVLYDGVYLGALFNSGAEIGSGKRQTASLTLSADAMVKAEASTNGWGIINADYAPSVLALNGHTLTVSGAGNFSIANVNSANGTTTTGTLVLDGVTLGFVGNADKRCNLTGVDIVAKGCAGINLAIAPTAIGSLTIKPSNAGTSASNWNLPSGFVPKVDTSNIDASLLSAGDTVTLLTVPSATTLVADSNVTVRASGRFEAAINEHTVTATLKAGMPSNFLHYDFNNDVAAAADSGTSFTVSGEGGSPAFVGAKNGRAVHVHTGYTPYWGSYANGTSPLHAGAVTVTTVAKLCETNIILWGIGSGSNGAGTRTGLVVKDAHTVQVLCEVYLNPVLVELTTTADLTQGWHFYVVVADADGVTLYVDREFAASDRVFSSKIGQQGQLGSFHGGAMGANKVGNGGYLLDDWRVYDTALTGAEIKGLKGELLPDAFFIRLR